MWFASLPKALLHRFAPGAAEDAQPEPAVPPGLELNQEMPIEVMRDFDTVLLFGRLAEAGPAHLRIERMLDGGCFPVLDEGGIVLVRGYDAQMNPVVLRAVVAESSGFGCTVEGLERICYETRRKLVRYPVCPPGAVYISDGKLPDRPQPCRLINISTGGACVVSERPYAVKQFLRLRIGPAEDGCAYPCQVVRATPRWGGCFEYGLRFAHLSGEQRRRLAQEIGAIRKGTEKRLLR